MSKIKTTVKFLDHGMNLETQEPVWACLIIFEDGGKRIDIMEEAATKELAYEACYMHYVRCLADSARVEIEKIDPRVKRQ